MTVEQSRERFLNFLAERVAIASRAAGSPINAYHARADIDELQRQGLSHSEVVRYYARFYGRAI